MDKEIDERVRQVYPKLLQLLKRKHPELVEIYKQRYLYATGPYPETMKLHNAYEILRAYNNMISK